VFGPCFTVGVPPSAIANRWVRVGGVSSILRVSDQDPLLAFEPLFPADLVGQSTASVGAAGDPRDGYVWPVEFVFAELEWPLLLIELAFWPLQGLPEPLAPESWALLREGLGLAAFAGAPSLGSPPDPHWLVEFGPQTLISNVAVPFHIRAPRPQPGWERAVRSAGSCILLLGSGLGVDEQSGAFAVGALAACVRGLYGGSVDVPELSEIAELHVVPVSSLRPYDPMRAQSFVLDTDVLIEIERFCVEPSRRGARSQAIRQVLVNLADRDVLPGAALSQLAQPSRSSSDIASATRAFAAFERLMSLSRRELLELQEPPANIKGPEEAEFVGAGVNPQMLLMYAGVLRLRQLWGPGQTFAQRVESFESFLGWMRGTLRMNAALLVQVAFNLWVADGNAHRQASRLLRFRAAAPSAAHLSQMWGTAFDLSLIAGHPDVLQIPKVPGAVILTFDRGVAEMRRFFEQVETAEVLGEDTPSGFPRWNARVWIEAHPGLGPYRRRVERAITDLRDDAVVRLSRGEFGAGHPDLDALVEEEELRLIAAG
jgi:hypothetical protein